MKAKAPLILVALLALFLIGPDASIADASQNAAAVRAGAKLQHIEKNAGLARPDRTPTDLTDDEINAYVAAGKVKLPVGVQSVTFQGQPGIVTASCRVDFDQIKAGRHTANPLLSLFSGIHDVVVVANAKGAQGQGLVEVQFVLLDGVEIPRFILELFVEKFLQPKYPSVGLESRFALPQKIDTAVVGANRLNITQK
jgi:hypothetical protein